MKFFSNPPPPFIFFLARTLHTKTRQCKTKLDESLYAWQYIYLPGEVVILHYSISWTTEFACQYTDICMEVAELRNKTLKCL